MKDKRIRQILDIAYSGDLQEVVVTYKDRLCRFGFELIEYVLQTQSSAKIVVLNRNNQTNEHELSTDLLSIITVFSARMHGLRKYKNKIKNDTDIFKTGIQEKNEELNRQSSLFL